MDIQTKINRLKQLKQRQAIINNKISENNKKNTSICTSKTPLLSKHDTHIPLLPENKNKPRSRKTISEQFIESNKETYDTLIEEAKKQSYIKTILNTINVNNTSHTNNVIDNIDLNNKEALINLFKTIKNNTHNTHNTPTTTEDINDISRLSSVSALSDMSDVSDVSDLSDSSDDEYTDYNTKPSTTRTPRTPRTTSPNNVHNTDDTKRVIISNTVNSKVPNTDDLLNKKKMLDDIEFLRSASSEVKAMCDNYLQNELNKITKIIKVYIIKSRNNFINISTTLLDYVFYGYKHIPYYDTNKLITGDLVKIIFTYDGYVYIKDFTIYKWNTKKHKLQCRYCTITYTDNDKIIKTSKTKIQIQPSWIIITKINPQELINYCNLN